MAHNLTSHPTNQSLPLPNQSFPLEKPSRLQVECEANGGRWDSKNKSCIFPDKKPAGVKQAETIFNEETGKPSGITLPDGRTFLGITREDIQGLIQQEKKKELPEGTVEAGTARRAAEQEQLTQEVLGRERPVKRELDPNREFIEKLPVLGGLFAAHPLIKTAIRSLEKLTGKQIIGEDLQPEELSTLALTAIEKREIEKGLTASEQFGSLIEGIGAGDLTRFIPGGSGAELPSDNVRTKLKDLRVLKSQAIDIELKFNKQLISKTIARERIKEIEELIQADESRIRLLISGSPELKFNSDGVNFIELKILEVKERLFDSETAVEIGVTTQPTEIDVLLALQEDFELP